MINPVWLTSYVEVAHRSTMAEAARSLKITSAAVSKHILSLENELGIQLFKRSTRRIELTQFLELYPSLRLNIEFTQTLPNLEKEHVDVVIGLSNELDHWVQRTLMNSRWVFCATPDYLKKFGVPKKPSDLAEHRIITRTQRQSNNIIEFKTGECIQFEPYLYFNDTRAIRRGALQHLGIAQLHDYIIADDLKENRLVEILSNYTEKKRTLPIHISYQQTSHIHLKIRKFIDYMVEVISRNSS